MALMSARLRTYLALERHMLALDEAGDPLADALRDAMDPIWYSLTDDEHQILNERTVVVAREPALAARIEPFFSPPSSTPIAPASSVRAILSDSNLSPAVTLDLECFFLPPAAKQFTKRSEPIHVLDWRCAA